MTGARAISYGLRQTDELNGAGVFSAIQLKRGESPAADAAASIASAAVILASVEYASGLTMVDGILKHVD